VRQIRREAARNGYKFSALALAIVNSTPFQKRKVPARAAGIAASARPAAGAAGKQSN
jgi:hypothetical protein